MPLSARAPSMTMDLNVVAIGDRLRVTQVGNRSEAARVLAMARRANAIVVALARLGITQRVRSSTSGPRGLLRRAPATAPCRRA